MKWKIRWYTFVGIPLNLSTGRMDVSKTEKENDETAKKQTRGRNPRHLMPPRLSRFHVQQFEVAIIQWFNYGQLYMDNYSTRKVVESTTQRHSQISRAVRQLEWPTNPVPQPSSTLDQQNRGQSRGDRVAFVTISNLLDNSTIEIVCMMEINEFD